MTGTLARRALAVMTVAALWLMPVPSATAQAQAPETPPARVQALTLEEATRRAEGHPSVVAAFEEVNGAAAGLAGARSVSWRWSDPFAFGPQSPATRRAQAALARADRKSVV